MARTLRSPTSQVFGLTSCIYGDERTTLVGTYVLRDQTHVASFSEDVRQGAPVCDVRFDDMKYVRGIEQQSESTSAAMETYLCRELLSMSCTIDEHRKESCRHQTTEPVPS
ncbi:hypothetical protein K439DRAFT_1632656 [Ramaria rubella]|nr:hypothetical protein K439DRAFT_1632656 [Ramaria rubella]